MRVGVLGGGIQGCCTALALAEYGIDVVLFDRNVPLLSRTAVANEGKIHLGYMYAADPALATAQMMMQGALAFAPFMQRHLGEGARHLQTSVPAVYVVHRDSQQSIGAVAKYLAAVHRAINVAARGRESHYFGLSLTTPPRPWSRSRLSGAFSPRQALAAFDSPEVAIDPTALAEQIRITVTSHPKIDVRLQRNVLRTKRGNEIEVTSEGRDGVETEEFDHVVNALWDGRLAIDATMGLRPNRPWLFRLKYGVSFKLPEGKDPPPSATFVSGPFGEVVSYPDRTTYLTWYPACLQGFSSELTPPNWETYPTGALREQILTGTLAAISDIVPSVQNIRPADMIDPVVKGGAIFAWGHTDIYDPFSELHKRSQIGVTSEGQYHSIDPGKLTMAPLFAQQCADRIAGCSPSAPLRQIEGLPEGRISGSS